MFNSSAAKRLQFPTVNAFFVDSGIVNLFAPAATLESYFFSLCHTASSRWAGPRYSLRHLRKVIRNVGAFDAPKMFLLANALANAARGF
jgi:hypothetical protein